MSDSKAPGLITKGRRVSMLGIAGKPEMWVIFDEPEDYDKDEQDEFCKTYHYQNKLHAMTAFHKIIKAYKRSRKDYYVYPIRLRRTKHNV